MCDIITPSGETQARQAGVIAVTHGKRGEILERATCDSACALACLYVYMLVCSGDSVSVEILEMVLKFSGFALVILSWMHVPFC